jgi:hypothetical protein
VALFIKTFTKLIGNLAAYQPPQGITQAYQKRFEELLQAQSISDTSKNLEGDQQIFIQEISRLLIVLSLRNPNQNEQTSQVMHVFASIFERLTEQNSDFVYTFLGQLHSALKKAKDFNPELNQALCDYLA